MSPLAAFPGVQTLSSGLRFADFSGDSTPAPRSGEEEAGGAGIVKGAAASALDTFTAEKLTGRGGGKVNGTVPLFFQRGSLKHNNE